LSAPLPVFSLSIHADYRCRHSGKCCTADWDVPVELPVYRLLSDAVAAGRLRVAPSAALSPFIVEPDLPEEAAAMLERTSGGECVFFERSSHLCVVHRDFGESALPLTCRHFPRVSLRDARGTFITLSHFCPTAAGMLFRRDVPLVIVRAPSAFPDADYDGLTVADDDLPPLLRPDVLMDPEGYTAWEAHMVARCAEENQLPESVLATLVRDAAVLRRWRPGSTTLVEAVHVLPREAEEAAPHENLGESLHFHRQVLEAVPEDLKPPPDDDHLDEAYRAWVRPAWCEAGGPVNRYIAAKAFASWTAYQGSGVATIVRGLEAAAALVRMEAARQCRNAGRRLDDDLLVEAFRSADFMLNHLAVGDELARHWSEAERER
jgi:Fe-S-cluster containining protein